LFRVGHHQHAEHAARGFVDVGLDGVGADGIRVTHFHQMAHLRIQAGQASVRQAGQQDQQGNHDAKPDGQALADTQVIDVHHCPRLDEKE